MSRYIDANKLYIAAMDTEFYEAADEDVVLDLINQQPTANVQEIRHGEWLEDDYGYCHCSECRYEHDSPEYITPYCPQCGAKMDEE